MPKAQPPDIVVAATAAPAEPHFLKVSKLSSVPRNGENSDRVRAQALHSRSTLVCDAARRSG